MTAIIRFEDMKLPALSEQCKEAYEETAWALENTLKKAVHFGRLLCIAKTKVPHGQWISWVAETFEDQVSLRNVQRFMQVAESNATEPSLLEGAKNLDEAMGRIQVKKPSVEVVPVLAEIVNEDEPRDIASEVAAECGVTRSQIIADGEYAEAVGTVAATVPDIRQQARSGKVSQDDVIAMAKEKPAKAKPVKATTTKPTTQKPSKSACPEYVYSIGECGYQLYVHGIYRQKISAKSGDAVSLCQLAYGETSEDQIFHSNEPEKVHVNVSEIDWRESDEEAYETDMSGSRRIRELDLRRFEPREGGGKYFYFEPGRVCYYDETAMNAILVEQARAHAKANK